MCNPAEFTYCSVAGLDVQGKSKKKRDGRDEGDSSEEDGDALRKKIKYESLLSKLGL